MKLPIRRIPGTVPPQFEYSQIVNSPNGGKQVIRHVGQVPPAMEAALCSLLEITEKLIAEVKK